MKPDGSLLYKDEYEQIYKIDWSTIGAVIDITTIIQQPYVWGEAPKGYIENGVLFRYGVISVIRQIIKPLEIGYMIVAEGISQYKDYVQMNYPCQIGFQDDFKFHLTNNISDEVRMIISSVSRWADPDVPVDENAIWGDVYDGGTEVEFTATGGSDVLTWVDVWPSL